MQIYLPLYGPNGNSLDIPPAFDLVDNQIYPGKEEAFELQEAPTYQLLALSPFELIHSPPSALPQPVYSVEQSLQMPPTISEYGGPSQLVDRPAKQRQTRSKQHGPYADYGSSRRRRTKMPREQHYSPETQQQDITHTVSSLLQGGMLTSFNFMSGRAGPDPTLSSRQSMTVMPVGNENPSYVQSSSTGPMGYWPNDVDQRNDVRGGIDEYQHIPETIYPEFWWMNFINDVSGSTPSTSTSTPLIDSSYSRVNQNTVDFYANVGSTLQGHEEMAVGSTSAYGPAPVYRNDVSVEHNFGNPRPVRLRHLTKNHKAVVHPPHVTASLMPSLAVFKAENYNKFSKMRTYIIPQDPVNPPEKFKFEIEDSINMKSQIESAAARKARRRLAKGSN